MNKEKKNPKPNVTFEPVKNLSPKKFWLTILSIVFGVLAVTVSFWAENNILFIFPMVIFAGLGFITHQKTYKDTLKTNNLAQTALILNLLVVVYVLIRVLILVFSFAMTRLI